jgi:predicted lipoprotein with Yx(FWY)xxD motif
MRPILKCLIPALAATLALAACGGSGSYGAGNSAPAKTKATGAQSGASSGQAGAALRTSANVALGATVLTNAQGMTLYSLSAEQGGKFICTGSCLQVWHPLAASSGVHAPAGVGSLGTIKRPDGGEQITYKGRPLYTFANDSQPGDAKGQGLKDVGTWGAVTVAVAGAPAAKTGSTSSGSTSSQSAPPSSEGAYHY